MYMYMCITKLVRACSHVCMCVYIYIYLVHFCSCMYVYIFVFFCGPHIICKKMWKKRAHRLQCLNKSRDACWKNK